MMDSKYWFLTYHRRRVMPDGPYERFCNEAIEMHPVDWIYKMNRDSGEYYTLIQAFPINRDRYLLFQKDCLKKGTRNFKRPSTARPTY